MAVTLEVKGLAEAVARLQGAPAEVRRAAEVAVEATAVEAARQAQANAPVDTGALRANIRVREAGPLTHEVVTDLPYSLRVEFGFVGTDSLGRSYNQAGQFYMTRAGDHVRPLFPRMLAEAIARAL